MDLLCVIDFLKIQLTKHHAVISNMGAHQFWKREQFNEKEHFSKKVGYNLATKLGGRGAQVYSAFI